MTAAVHILNEDASPPEAFVWTMICGAQGVFFDDGESVPAALDFVLPRDSDQATCLSCRAACENKLYGQSVERAHDCEKA